MLADFSQGRYRPEPAAQRSRNAAVKLSQVGRAAGDEPPLNVREFFGETTLALHARVSAIFVQAVQPALSSALQKATL
jgi:hypothetical protein